MLPEPQTRTDMEKIAFAVTAAVFNTCKINWKLEHLNLFIVLKFYFLQVDADLLNKQSAPVLDTPIGVWVLQFITSTQAIRHVENKP